MQCSSPFIGEGVACYLVIRTGDSPSPRYSPNRITLSNVSYPTSRTFRSRWLCLDRCADADGADGRVAALAFVVNAGGFAYGSELRIE